MSKTEVLIQRSERRIERLRLKVLLGIWNGEKLLKEELKRMSKLLMRDKGAL